MDMLRHIEQGSIQFLWISGTNPAVSLPELRRMRTLLTRRELFVVAQDTFETETTQVRRRSGVLYNSCDLHDRSARRCSSPYRHVGREDRLLRKYCLGHVCNANCNYAG